MSPTNDAIDNTNNTKDIDLLFKTKKLLEAPTEEQWKKLYQELETSPKQLKEDIKTIREWLSLQPHLPQTATDTLIASFLIGCKNSIQRTKQKLDAYYTVRGQMPQFFENRDPLTEDAKNAGIPVREYLLPKLDPRQGYRIISTSFRTSDPSPYNPKENLRRILALIDIRMHEESEGFYAGDFMICDAKLFTVGHALRLTPTIMKDFLYCVQDVLPLRIKGILFYNAPPLLEKTANNVVKPFLKKKIADRIYIYSEDHTVLLKHFPQKILPKNLGGDEETDETLNDLWDKKLESWRNWLMNEGTQCSNESKRPSDNQHKPSQFGIEGSFRKLAID
ncbi:alpha-tocopherol transfer protein-like [Lycorma delicatula]|uniref:alpha-tocopherol transfer protein-like n=1 Tax=Lycorma delicatula TaxID=130591 RepID=UPI003F519D20